MEQAVDGFFVLASLAAAWSDVRTRRVPNALTLSLIAFGITAQAITGGWLASLESLGLAALTIAIGSFVFARGWLAGGDIKLLAGGVAVFGYPAALDFLIFTALFGGVLASAVAVYQRRLTETLTHITISAIVPGMPLQVSKQYGSLPYGLAIAASAIFITLSRCFTGQHLPI